MEEKKDDRDDDVPMERQQAERQRLAQREARRELREQRAREEALMLELYEEGWHAHLPLRDLNTGRIPSLEDNFDYGSGVRARRYIVDSLKAQYSAEPEEREWFGLTTPPFFVLQMEIEGNERYQVVDGQNRIAALRELQDEGIQIPEIESFVVPERLWRRLGGNYQEVQEWLFWSLFPIPRLAQREA